MSLSAAKGPPPRSIVPSRPCGNCHRRLAVRIKVSHRKAQPSSRFLDETRLMNPQHKTQRKTESGPSLERGLQGRRTEDPLKRIGMFVVLAVGLASILIAACNGGDTPTPTERPDVTPAATLPRPTDTPPATVETPLPDPTPTAQATATRSPAPTPTTETPADSAKTASIAAIQSSGIGTILADSDGNTLYLFTNDESSMSNCSGGCAGAWPPLLTVGDPQPEEV